MDVDESIESATVGEPSPACVASDEEDVATPFPTTASLSRYSPPVIEVESEPELEADTSVHGLFKVFSPLRRGARRSLHDDSSISMSRDTPLQPVHKKRRSFSPDREFSLDQLALFEQDSLESSPGLMSSPSVSKLERLQARPLKPLPVRDMGPAPNTRHRRLALSALVPPTGTVIEPEIKTARPVMQGAGQKEEAFQPRRFVLPPVRRASSAAYPKTSNTEDKANETGSSLDSEFNDASSPAMAYAKRQQVKTIRRCDGTDDFRSMTGASAMLKRDNEVRPSRKSDEGVRLERDTPRSKYLNAMGSRALGGFGDSEASGKILPCHRVKSDGLMRITWDTVCIRR